MLLAAPTYDCRSLVAVARALAIYGHAGQVDKGGAPYFGHLERVATAAGPHWLAVVVAYLHDLCEDHPQYWPIIEAMFPLQVVAALRLLDRTGKSSRQYYAAIRTDPTALRVKLADISDNLDEQRLALIDANVADRLRAKYRRAITALTTA